MCSGPYAQSLLGLTDKNHDGLDVPNELNKDIEDALIKHKERAELLRPGFTRLSLPFKGLLEIEVEYVLRALTWVAEHGWALMCQYRCNHRTGEVRMPDLISLIYALYLLTHSTFCSGVISIDRESLLDEKNGNG